VSGIIGLLLGELLDLGFEQSNSAQPFCATNKIVWAGSAGGYGINELERLVTNERVLGRSGCFARFRDSGGNAAIGKVFPFSFAA
jgi:hypothetical protein